jgi:hypothetical protein
MESKIGNDRGFFSISIDKSWGKNSKHEMAVSFYLVFSCLLEVMLIPLYFPFHYTGTCSYETTCSTLPL